MAKAKKSAPEKSEGIDHGVLVTWVNEAEDATDESREMSEKCRDYYDSKQLTAPETKALKSRGQAPVVINRCKPKMDALMGMEKSAKTIAKAFPRTPKHAKAAEAASESLRFVLQDNAFDQVRSAVWEFILIEGTGGCDITVKPSKDGPRITLNSVLWDRLIYDPHSRHKHFLDARYLGQVVWMDWDDAIGAYPNAKDVLESMASGSQTYEDKPRWMDNSRKRVKIVELYYRDGGNWKTCKFTRGGFVEHPSVSPYVNEEGETEHAYEFASSFVDREGQRYGAMKQLLDIQDEINKRRSKALHLMSVRQVRSERGAVEDVNKSRQELAKPDGWIETTPGMEFEVLKTGDMAAAQFNLLTEAKMEIDAVGVNAALTGKDQRAISGVALQERKLAGQTELGPLFDVLRYWQLRVFRKVWNRIRQYWKEEKWIRVTDDEQNLRWVGLNAPITKGEKILREAKEKGVPEEALAQLAQQIALDPSMQEKVMENEVADLDVDIILQEVPDTVTMQVEEFQVLGEMVKSGIPIPPDAIIEASQLSNKDKILKAMRGGEQIPPQVQQKMQQMQEGVQMLQEELEKTKQENANLKTGAQEAAAKMELNRTDAKAQFELKSWSQGEELRLQKELQDGQAQLAREKAEAECDLKRQCAADDKELADAENARKNEQAEAENTRKNDQVSFDRDLKRQESGIEAETDVLPEIMAKLDQAFAPLAEILLRIEQGIAQSVKLQSETIKAIQAPKQVSIGSVERNSAGQITGGTVVPRVTH